MVEGMVAWDGGVGWLRGWLSGWWSGVAEWIVEWDG